MAIIRKPMQSKQFTQVPNHWTRDARLSPAGLGLLTYICSHAASYNLTVRQMLAEHPRGITAIRAAIREIERLGYLIRTQQRRNGRFGEYDYEIVEFPQVATGERFSDDGKTDDGSLADGKSTPKNTTTENTNLEKTNESGPVPSCTTSDRFAHFGAGDTDEALFSDDDGTAQPEPDPATERYVNWRVEDRALFRSLLGDCLTSDGSGPWNEVTADVDAWYQGFRQHPKRRWKWPGRLLQKIVDDTPAGDLEDWMLNEGLTRQ